MTHVPNWAIEQSRSLCSTRALTWFLLLWLTGHFQINKVFRVITTHVDKRAKRKQLSAKLCAKLTAQQEKTILHREQLGKPSWISLDDEPAASNYSSKLLMLSTHVSNRSVECSDCFELLKLPVATYSYNSAQKDNFSSAFNFLRRRACIFVWIESARLQMPSSLRTEQQH